MVLGRGHYEAGKIAILALICALAIVFGCAPAAFLRAAKAITAKIPAGYLVGKNRAFNLTVTKKVWMCE